METNFSSSGIRIFTRRDTDCFSFDLSETLCVFVDGALDLFRNGLNGGRKWNHIIIQPFDESNKFEVFEAFCKKHFPYRLSDPYREDGYFDFLASAFVGKDNSRIDGILIRTDVEYYPDELQHTLIHELAHIYCVHNELAGKDFYGLYCNGTAPTVQEDGIINADYAIWRECIAEVIARKLNNSIANCRKVRYNNCAV